MSNYHLYFKNKSNLHTPKSSFLLDSNPTSSLGKVECSSMNSLSNFMKIICHDINKPIKKRNDTHLYNSNFYQTAPKNIKEKISDLYKEIYSEPKKNLNSFAMNYKAKTYRKSLTANNSRIFELNQLKKMININNESNNNTYISSSRVTKESDELTEDLINLNVD